MILLRFQPVLRIGLFPLAGDLVLMTLHSPVDQNHLVVSSLSPEFRTQWSLQAKILPTTKCIPSSSHWQHSQQTSAPRLISLPPSLSPESTPSQQGHTHPVDCGPSTSLCTSEAPGKFLTSYFEIVIDSQEVVKIVQNIHSPLHFSSSSSCSPKLLLSDHIFYVRKHPSPHRPS